MKKIIKLLAMLLLILGISSCYDTSNKNYIEIKEVNVFNSANEKLTGTYNNLGFLNTQVDEDISITKLNTIVENNNISITKLNSAAPVQNYYQVNVDLLSTIKIELKLTVKEKYTLTDLTLSEKNLTDLNATITEDSNYTIVTFTINNVTASNATYSLQKYKLLDTSSNVEKDYYYSISGGSTHKMGVSLIINSLPSDIISGNDAFTLYDNVTSLDLEEYIITNQDDSSMIFESILDNLNGSNGVIYRAQKFDSLWIITSITIYNDSLYVFNNLVSYKLTTVISNLEYYAADYQKVADSENNRYIYSKNNFTFIINYTADNITSFELSVN